MDMRRVFDWLFTHWDVFQNYVMDAYDQGYDDGAKTGEVVGSGAAYRAGFDEGEKSGRRQATNEINATETDAAATWYDGYAHGYAHGFDRCLTGKSHSKVRPIDA